MTLALSAPAEVAAQESPDTANALEAVLERRRFQQELPGMDWGEDFDAPAGQRTAPTGKRQPPGGSVTVPRPKGRSSGGGTSVLAGGPILFWTVILVVVGALIAWLVQAWTRSNRDMSLPERTPTPEKPPGSRAGPTLSLPGSPRDAAVLAAEEERYLEAIHLLLLAALARVSGGSASSLEDASTSRERLAGTPTASVEHATLEVLVGAVERTLFGGRAAERADFERSLSSYDRLVAGGSP